jgi:hypothetical protein
VEHDICLPAAPVKVLVSPAVESDHGS